MEYTLNIRGRLMDLSHPQVMGIINVTPDSFYEGSRKQTEREIAMRAEEILAQGGSMIDIGAFSTPAGAVKGQVEDNAKKKQMFFLICIVEATPTLSIDSASGGSRRAASMI